jgi:prepilin-type N-terminal cleavage/methylation domain-containing protein
MMRPSATRSVRPGKRSGFSLVELLLVLVVLGIAVNLAMPMMGSTEPSRLRAAARLLEADLGAARIRSITHADDPCIVIFDPTADGYHLAHRSDSNAPITNQANGTTYRVVFGKGRASKMEGVRIEDLAMGGDQRLGFGGYGELDQPTEAQITLTTENHRLHLTLDPATGEVTVGEIE